MVVGLLDPGFPSGAPKVHHVCRCPQGTGREENCFAGGGWHGSPFAQTPPPSLVAVPGGGFGLGLPYLPC